MSEKDQQSKFTREERLAAELRANLRRRKQAARKGKVSTFNESPGVKQNSDKPSP